MCLDSLGTTFLDFEVLVDQVLFALLLKLGRLWIAISSGNLIHWLMCFLIKILSALLPSVWLLLILLVETASLISAFVTSICLVNHSVTSSTLKRSSVEITCWWSAHHAYALTLHLSWMNLLLLSKVGANIKSWIIKVIILIRRCRTHWLLNWIAIRIVVLRHDIIGLDLALVANVLLLVHRIKFALILLEHHSAWIVVIVNAGIVLVDWVKWVAMRLLIIMTAFVATSLLIHLLVVLVVDVVRAATGMATLAIVLGGEWVAVTSSTTVKTTIVTSFTALHLI